MSAAAVVWLGAFVVLLRIVSMIAFVAAVAWLAWLVGRVWRQRSADWEAPSGSSTRLARARAHILAARDAFGRGEPDAVEDVEDSETQAAQWEAGLADVRGAVTALHNDLLRWHERLVDEVERCQSELASQIDALHEFVDGAALWEQTASHPVSVSKTETSPAREEPAPTVSRSSGSDAGVSDDADIQAVLNEIEADLRLEKIEERERLVADREERLDRRERDIAAFVTQTQARIG